MREDEQGTAVYAYIVEHGSATVAQIATTTGLAPAVVREILARFLDGGLVVSGHEPGGEPGYRSNVR